MKPNINNIPQIQGLKKVLTEKNVSANAISIIESSLNKGVVFKKPEDLEILNISPQDLNVIRDSVIFGDKIVIVKNIKRIEYIFIPKGEERYFFGYQFIVRYSNKEGFTIEQSYPIESTRTAIIDFDLNDILDGSKISLQVKSAQGKYVSLSMNETNLKDEIKIIDTQVSGLTNAKINVAVDVLTHSPNPPIKGSYQIKGKLISNRTLSKLEGYQIVIYAAASQLPDDTYDYVPVAFATTESNGYFVTSFLIFNNPDDINNVKAGKAVISRDGMEEEQNIKLIEKIEGSGRNIVNKSMLPDRLILVINEDIEENESVSTCNDLNFLEKKTFEEHSYYTVVRTTEPSIIADVLEEEKEIDLEEIYGVNIKVPINVLRKFVSIEKRQIKPSNFGVANFPSKSAERSITLDTSKSLEMKTGIESTNITRPILNSTFNKDLLDKLMVDYKVNKIIMGNEKPVFKGRTPLNPLSQIQWDEDITIYQAASIAHGHILHFKQEWIPDGYSIGDLAYSLPLAPGQKKQIAVLDWERRESAANSQFLDYEESLNNSLIHDRDISEVVNATLTENIRASSRASTSGIGGGTGGSIMGVFTGGSYGGVLGISGGTSSSGSTAIQNSNRESTASSIQNIRDRTSQASEVVRSQRSTVIQTVSQGEKVQATAESVANYNHCHAVTIEYFEVLRHFAVQTRLAGVQECLFIPLQMTSFDVEKCLRWRSTLEKCINKRQLLSAFDAIARIKQEQESPFENYYDSIGFPRKYFAEQNVTFYTGNLQMEFFFFNTNEDKIDDELIKFYSFFGISLDSLRDRKITDEELANHVGPRSIEYLLDAFVIETDKGANLNLDLTLTSSFRQNSILRVTLRQSTNTPITIPRDQIDGIKIRLDLGKLPSEQADNLKQFQKKFMKIRIRSGSLRYRTNNFSGILYNESIDNDIFADGDGVFISTPLNKEELRNPRGEDVDAANNLLHHLNENFEYYNKCIFFDMTPERRFMLLDGIIAPGKANGRSVASVVENRIIGVAGNSLIMPVAPGYQLDPTIDETFDLFAQYYNEEQEPMRISLPTKGIYAEAVTGKCNSCEEKDETRFWRWEESPIPDSPNTQILPLNTDTRRTDPGNLQPKDFPTPVVNIQNAPTLPDPTALKDILQLIGKGDAFRDLTGLNQNQLNALATFQKTLDTAQAFGKEASELAKMATKIQLAQSAQKSGSLSNADTNASIKNSLDPEEQLKDEKERRETVRDETIKDAETIDEQKQKGRLDDDQAQDMTEDVIRKDQGTTKPTVKPTAKKGKKKYNLTLLLKNYEGRPLVGTWELTYGSLVNEGFEITGSDNSVKEFVVEIERSKENILQIKGNPYLTGTSTFGDPELYFHYSDTPTVTGNDNNLTFEIFQTRVERRIEEAEGTTTSKVLEDAVARELSIESSPEAEIDLAVIKFGGSVSITGSRTKTHSETSETGTTETRTEEYTYKVPARRLKIKQKGVAVDELDLSE